MASESTDAQSRVAEIRQENRGGDVSYRDIEWLCDEVERLSRALREVAVDNNDHANPRHAWEWRQKMARRALLDDEAAESEKAWSYEYAQMKEHDLDA